MLISNSVSIIKLISKQWAFLGSIKGEPWSPQTFAAVPGLAGHRTQTAILLLNSLKAAHGSPTNKETGCPGLKILFAHNSKTFWIDKTACPHQFLLVTPGVQRRWRCHQQTAPLPSPERRTGGEREGTSYTSGTLLRGTRGGGGGWGTGREGLGRCEENECRGLSLRQVLRCVLLLCPR